MLLHACFLGQLDSTRICHSTRLFFLNNQTIRFTAHGQPTSTRLRPSPTGGGFLFPSIPPTQAFAPWDLLVQPYRVKQPYDIHIHRQLLFCQILRIQRYGMISYCIITRLKVFGPRM